MGLFYELGGALKSDPHDLFAWAKEVVYFTCIYSLLQCAISMKSQNHRMKKTVEEN